MRTFRTTSSTGSSFGWARSCGWRHAKHSPVRQLDSGIISTSISTRKHSFRSLRRRVPTAPKVVLKRLAKDARHWIALADGVPGQGRRLFELVAKNDLE